MRSSSTSQAGDAYASEENEVCRTPSSGTFAPTLERAASCGTPDRAIIQVPDSNSDPRRGGSLFGLF